MKTSAFVRKCGFGQLRYLDTNSAQGSFSLTAGRRVGDLALPLKYLAIPAGALGAIITPFGTGADNDTFGMRVWKAVRAQALSGTKLATTNIPDRELEYIGESAVTLSAAVGAANAGVPILSTERIADTIVWTVGSGSSTPKGIGDLLNNNASLGSSGAYSPANDTPAKLFIPTFGGGDEIVLEFDLTGTSTGANALVEFLA